MFGGDGIGGGEFGAGIVHAGECCSGCSVTTVADTDSKLECDQKHAGFPSLLFQLRWGDVHVAGFNIDSTCPLV